MAKDLDAPAKPRSGRKAKGEGHLRRAEILDAAERIFVADGYERATMRRIADEVGVSSAAIYIHFADKAAMLGEICRRSIEAIIEQNRAIAGREQDAAARARAMLQAYVRWGLAHPNAYQLVYTSSRPLSAGLWSEDTVDLSEECYEIFADVVREIAAQGRLRAGAPEAAAQALWMAAHGVVALICARPKFSWADHEVLLQLTLDALMSGLVAA